MFDNVMIGIDGEQGGRDAIALARQLASDNAKFTLAYVHGEHALTFKGSGIASLLVVGERERAQELLAKTLTEARIEASLASTRSSSVGAGLHELAEQNQAEALVVGSSRHGLVGRVVLGDDTRSALNGAPCSVAIAPTGYAESVKPLRRIGVAFNGSPESRHALSVARALGTHFGAKLSACDVMVAPAYMYLAAVPTRAESTDELAGEFEAGLLDDFEFHAPCGFPAEELGFYSGSVDLLLAGSRGYGPVARLMHGSTTAQLTRTARCPLLVLTRNGGIDSEPNPTGSGQVAANV